MFCLHGTVMEQVAFKGLELSYGYEKTCYVLYMSIMITLFMCVS